MGLNGTVELAFDVPSYADVDKEYQHVDVVQNPGARYKAAVKAVVRITLKKAQGEGFSFQDSAEGMYQYGLSATNNLATNNPARRTFILDLTWKFNEVRSRSAMPLGSSKKYRGSGAGDKQKAHM